MTIAKADATSTMITLMPARTVTVTAPVAVDQIQSGSHVATANKAQAVGSGVCTEIRVFPPEITALEHGGAHR